MRARWRVKKIRRRRTRPYGDDNTFENPFEMGADDDQDFETLLNGCGPLTAKPGEAGSGSQ